MGDGINQGFGFGTIQGVSLGFRFKTYVSFIEVSGTVKLEV